MGMCGQRHVPAALAPGKTRHVLYRRLASTGFGRRTVHPIASRDTDWAIPAHDRNEYYEYRPTLYFMRGKGWQPHHLLVPIVWKSGSPNLLELSGPFQARPLHDCQSVVSFLYKSTNSVEDRGQRERESGGGCSPLVRGSGGSCNLVQEISFHIVKFS